MHIRLLTPDDRDTICHHREAMFRDSGRSAEVIAQMSEPFRAWLGPHLEAGRYFGWLAEYEGRVVAGVGMMVIDWPPHPSHPTQCQRGYILNVYVEPEFRGQGVAKKLMAEANAEAKRRGIQFMILHATAQGRPLYEALGWLDTAEMALTVPDA